MALARDHIKEYLALDDQIEIVAECRNGLEAVEAIKRLSPDLIFLDVQMPQLDGFGVIKTIGIERMPTVIFVTAYDEFALHAFEVNALDYLLKPFDDQRLAKTVARAKREIERNSQSENSINLDTRLQQLLQVIGNNKPVHLKRFYVKSATETVLVACEKVDWIGAAGNYIELHIANEIQLVRDRISEVDQKLDPEMFIRIHRSTIVNINRIRTLHPLFNGDQLVVLHDGTRLNMSRTYHEKLLLTLQGK